MLTCILAALVNKQSRKKLFFASWPRHHHSNRQRGQRPHVGQISASAASSGRANVLERSATSVPARCSAAAAGTGSSQVIVGVHATVVNGKTWCRNIDGHWLGCEVKKDKRGPSWNGSTCSKMRCARFQQVRRELDSRETFDEEGTFKASRWWK